jgi:hypothetical protein
VDANSYQGTLVALNSHMEATEHGWNCMVLMAPSASMEQRWKETATEALAVYQATISKVSPTDSVVLHHARIDEILKWTKEHLLDAYLASADVIINQRDMSRVNFYPSWAGLLYALWIGSHMALTDVVF